MYLALEMHLDAFLSIVDGLDGSTDFADLGEEALPFVALQLPRGCHPSGRSPYVAPATAIPPIDSVKSHRSDP